MNLQREDIHPVQDTCPYFSCYLTRLLCEGSNYTGMFLEVV